MSLKEIVKEKHTEAENTPFMQAVFKKQITPELWQDWTYQKVLFYSVIENSCMDNGYFNYLPGIERSHLLMKDYLAMTNNRFLHIPNSRTLNYYNYLRRLSSKNILAHFYTWHFGDLFGGQMIRKIVPFCPHYSLDFSDIPSLVSRARELLSDDLGEEAIRSFEWAISLLHEYDDRVSV